MSGRDFGSTMPMPFAHLDRGTSSWRTCQGSLLEDSGEFCTTWPRQGTWDLGFAYELLTSVLPTDENGSSSLLPTPNASDGPKGGPNRRDGKGTPYLSGVQALLPTPSAFESTPTEEFVEEPPLNAVAKLLPTPTNQASKHGETRDLGANAHGYNLWDLPHLLEDQRLLPTPTSGDSHSTRNNTGDDRGWERGSRHAGTTLTDAMSPGEPMSLPSASGSESSDKSPPGQLTIEDG